MEDMPSSDGSAGGHVRCSRNDGKNWRCNQLALPGSRHCAKHSRSVHATAARKRTNSDSTAASKAPEEKPMAKPEDDRPAKCFKALKSRWLSAYAKEQEEQLRLEAEREAEEREAREAALKKEQQARNVQATPGERRGSGAAGGEPVAEAVPDCVKQEPAAGSASVENQETTWPDVESIPKAAQGRAAAARPERGSSPVDRQASAADLRPTTDAEVQQVPGKRPAPEEPRPAKTQHLPPHKQRLVSISTEDSKQPTEPRSDTAAGAETSMRPLEPADQPRPSKPSRKPDEVEKPAREDLPHSDVRPHELGSVGADDGGDHPRSSKPTSKAEEVEKPSREIPHPQSQARPCEPSGVAAERGVDKSRLPKHANKAETVKKPTHEGRPGGEAQARPQEPGSVVAEGGEPAHLPEVTIKADDGRKPGREDRPQGDGRKAAATSSKDNGNVAPSKPHAKPKAESPTQAPAAKLTKHKAKREASVSSGDAPMPAARDLSRGRGSEGSKVAKDPKHDRENGRGRAEAVKTKPSAPMARSGAGEQAAVDVKKEDIEAKESVSPGARTAAQGAPRADAPGFNVSREAKASLEGSTGKGERGRSEDSDKQIAVAGVSKAEVKCELEGSGLTHTVDLSKFSSAGGLLKQLRSMFGCNSEEMPGLSLVYQDRHGDWMLLQSGEPWPLVVQVAKKLLLTPRPVVLGASKAATSGPQKTAGRAHPCEQ